MKAKPRKRIKKYEGGGFTGGQLQTGLSPFGAAAGTFIQQEDQADGNYSHLGAFGGGALKGASMGAALGPWGAAAGAAIGGVVGLIQRDKIQEGLDAEAEAKRKAEEERERQLKLAKRQANDAILEQFPVDGVYEQRYALGGSTLGDPKKPQGGKVSQYQTKPDGSKYGVFDLPKEAMSVVLKNDNVMSGLKNLNEEELTALIGASSQFKDQIADMKPAEALKFFANEDMSWIKPLRQKTGLSKNELIDAVINAGVVKEGYGTPLKAAAAFKSFNLGGTTVPQYKAEGGEMIQHKPGDLPRTDTNGGLNRITGTEAEITGDKHSANSGGVGMSDKKGARIYSDQLTVDKDLAAKLAKL